MAIPRVNLRKVERKKGHVYMLDYAVDGKRYRETLGSDRRDAEILKAAKQSDLARGTFVPPTNPTPVTLSNLFSNYMHSKKHTIRDTSMTRYDDYRQVVHRRRPDIRARGTAQC